MVGWRTADRTTVSGPYRPTDGDRLLAASTGDRACCVGASSIAGQGEI